MRWALLLATGFATTSMGVEAQATAAQYERTCERGDLVACTVLGLIYQTGAGGVRDLARATDLYQRSCGRGVMVACRRLEFVEDGGSAPDPVDSSVRVGYVADAYDGTPLAGAIVSVRGIAGIGERRYLTDQVGRVVLDPLPRGRHPIAVRHGGYQLTEGDLPVPWETDFLILIERLGQEEDSQVGQIFGQVTEEGTTDGIADVDVIVSGGTTARTISNRQGRFQLSGLEPGEVEVEFQRVGYETRRTMLTVQRGRTSEVYATMSTEPFELEPVEVTVASRYLVRSGFYRRARNTAGDRFTHRDIAQMNPLSVGDVLRRVGGVTVVAAQIGWGSEAISNRRRAGAAAGRCVLRPYWNGVPTVDSNLELLPPEEIEALEVYQGPNVPIEYLDAFQLRGPSCGVVLIWTRDPRRPN